MEIGITMTKIRKSMLAALAVTVVFGVCRQQALAQSLVLNPHVHSVVIGKSLASPDAEPDATASQVHQLYTTMNELPPLDTSGNPEWPCAGGGADADCSSIAEGGLVIGFPFYTWPLTTCTSSTEACGEITWMFETDVASTKAAIDVTVTVTQGTTTKTTIYSSGKLSAGTNPGAGYTEVYALPVAFGSGDCATGTCGTPVAGPATITVVTTIGTQKATGTAQIKLSSTE
jgi:hypothetical protein